MAEAEHWAYRRSVPYTLLWLTMPIGAAGTLVGLLLSGDRHAGVAMAIVLPVFAITLLLLGRMTIEVSSTTLRWGFGWMPWPRWQVALKEIVHVEQMLAPKLAGSGIQRGSAGRLYNTRIGGPVLRLSLRNGRTLLIGSDEPERLAAFIATRR